MLLAQMDYTQVEKVGEAAAILFIIGMLLCALGVMALFYLGWWLTNRPGSVSPYTGSPMASGSQLSYEAVRKVHVYLESLPADENPFFELNKAAVCRETGRIFPHAVNFFDIISVNWTFLNKRYPGNYVSWGSLSEGEKEDIFSSHTSLEGYQTEHSCPNASPKEIDSVNAMSIPGPLYVDVESKTLLGWKRVPDTGLEVLVAQRPTSS